MIIRCMIIAFVTFEFLCSREYSSCLALKFDEFIGSEGLAVSKANSAFTNDLYLTLTDVKRDNYVVSPLSLGNMLALLLVGADGITADELYTSLKFTGINETAVFEGFSDIIFSLHENRDAVVEMANRLYVANRIVVRHRFLQILRDKFYAVAKPINFAQSYDAADEINEWVFATTRGKIDNIISPDTLSRRTAAVLINSLYFRGKWRNEFELRDTRQGVFNTEEGRQIQVQVMEQEDEFLHGEIPEIRSTVLSLPYKGNRFSFVVVLPNEGVRLRDVEDRIERYNVLLANIPSRLEIKYIRVSLPKFRIETETDLIKTGILQKLGLKSMINPGTANFAGITSDAPIHIDAVIQKAFIEINEAGTEAASASYAKAVPLSFRYSVPFTVDKPFLAFIHDEVSNTVLFVVRKAF